MSLARSVHRLAIAAPSAELARRAALLVEDALRTASLPGDGGELVLVRRLELAAFGTTVSAQGVALGLESAFRALSPVSGRDADDTRLAAARAVRFSDALEAHLALTARLLAGRPVRAWCWALAVPGYHPDAGAGAGLRSVALSLARLEEAPAALPHWFGRVVAWGGAERLLLALAADDAALIAQRCPPSRPPTAVEAHHAFAWQRAQSWAAQHLADDDPRRALLESMAAGVAWTPATEHEVRTTHGGARDARAESRRHGRPDPALEGGMTPPERVADTPAPAEATELARARTATASRRHGTPAGGDASAPVDPAARARTSASSSRSLPPRPNSGPDAGLAPVRAVWRVRPAVDDPAACRAMAAVERASAASRAASGGTPRRDGADPARAAGAGRADAGPASRPAPLIDTLRGAATPPPAGGWMTSSDAIDAPSRAGGLLFLLPVLERIGLPAWLAAHPAESPKLPAQVIGLLLHRLRVADDDPAWWLGRIATDTGERTHAAHWLAAGRRHLRVAIGIGPASLCLRPAQMVLTPTHAEVWLGLEQLDLRIRRAGLDIDPGWLPWFGRVVRFHYGRKPA